MQVDSCGDCLAALAALVAGERGGRGELHVDVRFSNGGQAQLCLGRNFALDTELANQMERIDGVTSVTLGPIDSLRLALVS